MEMPSIITKTDGPNLESSNSGIHWSSILGGAAAAAAISLILIPMGSALGFGSVSVFNTTKSSVTALTAGFAIWLVIMQWVSSGVGGYIAGRLRVKWADLHSDEVFFRDTAHGLIAWAVATLITAGLIASVTLSSASLGVQAAAPEAETGIEYYVDGLYRTDTPASTPATVELTAETTRIFLKTINNNALALSDRAYLTHLVAVKTGLSPSQAEARVDNAVNQINTERQKVAEVAEAARKVTVEVSILLFLSLIVGAFIACVSAALGGRLRDL